MSVRWLLLCLLLASCLCLTSLSSNNCPDSFDITSDNSSVSTSALTSFIYQNIYSPADEEQMKEAFASGSEEEVRMKLYNLELLLPFVLIGVAFLVLYVIAICCCVFEKSCPPCQSWKRDFSVRPYEKFELNCVTVFAAIFAFAITVTTVMALVYFPDMEEDVELTKCSMYYSLDMALNGELSEDWGGYIQLTNQIGNMSTLLTSAATSVNTHLSNKEFMKTGMDALKQDNNDIYTDNRDSKVISPNPSTVAAAVAANTPLPTITTLFVSQGLGPNSTADTMTYSIDQALGVTENCSDQGYNVYQAAKTLSDSSANIQANVGVAMDSLTMNLDYLYKAQAAVDELSAEVFDSVFNWGFYLIEALLAFILVGSVLVLLGLLATQKFEMLGCKTSVHLGWVIYGVTYFGVVVLTFDFFAMGGIIYNFCEWYEGVIDNQSSFASYSNNDRLSQFNRLFQRLDTCFYGNGTVSEEYQIKSELQTVSNLYAEITTYLNTRDASTTSYVDLTAALTNINGWMTAMENYKIGLYVDSNTVLNPGEDDPYEAIKGMNVLTNNGTGGVPPSCTNDYWVFDTNNCTNNATETVYTESLTSGTTFATTGTTCISLHQKFSSGESEIWKTDHILDRYRQHRQCEGSTQAYDQMSSYATSLVYYRDSRVNLYTNLKDQLQALYNATSSFNTNIDGFTTSVNTYVTETSTLNTLVTNQINGIDHSSNCTAIANGLRFFYNKFCVNFLTRLVQFGVCCLTLLIVMIGGVLTGSVFAIRFGRIEKDRRTVIPQTPASSQLHSQTFEKRNQSSSSSSSSSDED